MKRKTGVEVGASSKTGGVKKKVLQTQVRRKIKQIYNLTMIQKNEARAKPSSYG